MGKYITEIDISLDKAEENQLRKHGFTQLHVNLNPEDKDKGVYLWYKTSDCPAITRIQFSFNHVMSEGMVTEGYHKIDKNLNVKTGCPTYLWFYKGSTQHDIPIVELDLSTRPEDDANKFQPFWERLAHNLNPNTEGTTQIYLWVRRETQMYICDITATAGFDGDANLFRQGYLRLDEDTNRNAGGAFVFIWYRQTTDSQKAIKDLQVSTDTESLESYQNQYYDQVPTDLNQGTKAAPVYLWFKKSECSKDPIKAVTVILANAAVQLYKSAGVEVLEKNLNTGNKGVPQYLGFYY